MRVAELVEALNQEAEDALGRAAHYAEQDEILRATIEQQVAYGLFLVAGVTAAIHDGAYELDDE